MEKKATFITRENNNQFFDKRLIKEIIKAVEEGLPRREAISVHGITKALNQPMGLLKFDHGCLFKKDHGILISEGSLRPGLY